jgi:hypothetical protein
MAPNEAADRLESLRRRVALLETDNKRLHEAVGFAVRTLDLHRDPNANPLAKAADAARAEQLLREAASTYR